MKLTQAVIDKGRIDTSGKADFIAWDDDLPSFGLRIREGGSRNYIIQYKIGGQQRRKTLGSTKELQLDQARKLAKKDLGRVANGEDPQGEKNAARATAGETFGAIAGDFIEFQTKKLRPSSLYSTKLYLLNRCKRLHALKIEAVTKREIASVLGSIASSSGAVSADRAASALSKMFAWAIGQGLIDANPTIGINSFAGNIDRDRVLADTEIVAIWQALPEGDYGRIVRLLFLTGARPDEIGGLTWTEISDGMIRLPQERCKNNRAFDLPLSPLALDIISEIEQRDGRDFVFGKGKGGFQGWSKAKRELDAELKGMKGPWQLRDIRRTVATGMASEGVQPHIVEACLNHVSGAKAGVAGVYNRATYAAEKAAALDLWANHIKVILAQTSGDNVKRLHNHSSRGRRS